MVFNPSLDLTRPRVETKKDALRTKVEQLADSRNGIMSEKITVRTVYDFPVAGHLCDDGTVRYIKLMRRSGQQPEGTCPICKTSFVYQKPKASKNARHVDGEGIVHF
jgi:hypothetical protein